MFTSKSSAVTTSSLCGLGPKQTILGESPHARSYLHFPHLGFPEPKVNLETQMFREPSYARLIQWKRLGDAFRMSSEFSFNMTRDKTLEVKGYPNIFSPGFVYSQWNLLSKLKGCKKIPHKCILGSSLNSFASNSINIHACELNPWLQGRTWLWPV